MYTLHCFVRGTVGLRWTPPNGTPIYLDSNPPEVHSQGFTVRLVDFDFTTYTISSNLSFTATQSMDDGVFKCIY